MNVQLIECWTLQQNIKGQKQSFQERKKANDELNIINSTLMMIVPLGRALDITVEYKGFEQVFSTEEKRQW